MPIHHRNCAQLLLPVALLVGHAHATTTTLASWEVNGVNAAATNPFAASTLSAGVASASLTLGAGTTSASSTANTFGGAGFNQTSLAAAITDQDYLSFTLSAGAGFKLGLDSIAWNSGVITAVTNFNAHLLSSATGFTTADSLFSYSFGTTIPANQSVTLSSITALQDLTGPVEFRLYGFRDGAGTSTFRIRDLSGADLIITGTATAIPEPAAYAYLLGFGALGFVLALRFRFRPAKAPAMPGHGSTL